MIWRCILFALAGCGRIGFDAGGGDGGGGGDTISVDGLPPDLVVWFTLETTTPIDIVSGGTGTCTTTQCPTVTTGFRGNALLFDGGNDCIVIADYAALHQPTLTVAVWVNANGLQDSSAVAKRVDDMTGTAYDTWELGAGIMGELELTSNHNGASEQIGTPPGLLAIGSWQHVAFTWDGAVKRLYVGGIERAMAASAQPLSYDTNNAYVGCDDNGSLVRFFSGAVDDMQVYSRALSSTEIQMLAND